MYLLEITGLLMDSKVICSVSYLGVTKLISISKCSSFNDFVRQLHLMWVQIVGFNVSISCQVGEVCNILIVTDEDINNLFRMCDVLGAQIVYVKLNNHIDISSADHRCLGDSLPRGMDDYGCGHLVSGLAIETEHCVDGMLLDTPIQTDDIVVPSTMNTLLSDGWANLMKGGVGTLYYGSAADFRTTLIKYCSKVGARISYIRNSPSLIHVACFFNFEEGCKWFVKARLVVEKRSFLVISADVNHTCSCQSFIKSSSDMLTPSLIADLLMPNVRNKFNMCAKDVADAMLVGYGFDIPYWKANRAAVIGRCRVYGNQADSYDTMFYYCKALQVTNPGSVVRFELEPNSNRFSRVFIALGASITGFNACVPMLFVDGTFLKGRSEGILLVAIAKDGNRGLFPFAFALVSAENTPNWAWFLSNVKACVHHESKVYYFSDRNAGLMAAFPLVFNDPVHFFCLYHLLSNLKARFSGGIAKDKRSKYHRLFKECAYELDLNVFDSKMAEFRRLGGNKAEIFLSQLPYEKWAIAFSPIMSRFGEMTSNAAECFNSWLLAARSLPIHKLFDAIRFGICRWFVERYRASIQFKGLLVPRRQDDWNRMVLLGVKWKIVMCPGGVFEVLSIPSACVDLKSRTCSCNVWQAVGFPCAHAVAVIRKERSGVGEDVERYFLSKTYQECYSGTINPVCDMSIAQVKMKLSMPKIEAPLLSKLPGRPKSKKRLTSYVELAQRNSKKTYCGKCGCCSKHDLWTCGSVRRDIDLNLLAQPTEF